MGMTPSPRVRRSAEQVLNERKGQAMFNKLSAFVLGMREFRLGSTTHFDYPLIETYDRGRDLMHKLTFRRYDW